VLAAAAAAVYRRLKDRQVRPVPPRAQAAGCVPQRSPGPDAAPAPRR